MKKRLTGLSLFASSNNYFRSNKMRFLPILQVFKLFMAKISQFWLLEFSKVLGDRPTPFTL